MDGFVTYLLLTVGSAISVGMVSTAMITLCMSSTLAVVPHRSRVSPGPIRRHTPSRRDQLGRGLVQLCCIPGLVVFMGASTLEAAGDGAFPISIAIAFSIELVAFAVGATIYTPIALRRMLSNDLRYLRSHAVPARAIQDLARTRVTINLTGACILVCDSFPLFWAITWIWSPPDLVGPAIAAAMIGWLILGFLSAFAFEVAGRTNVTDGLLRTLGYACAPDEQPKNASVQPPSRDTGRHRGPEDIFSSGLSPQHSALLAAQKQLRAVLWRRLRRWPWVDRNAVLVSAKPLFTDLTNLALSGKAARDINSSITVTRVIHLAVLGNLHVLGPDRLHLADLADHRAWNPWRVSRIISFLVAGATSAAGLLTTWKNLNG